jgi:hypothetical protein
MSDGVKGPASGLEFAGVPAGQVLAVIDATQMFSMLVMVAVQVTAARLGVGVPTNDGVHVMGVCRTAKVSWPLSETV